MKTVAYEKFDEERAFYEAKDIFLRDCTFDGEADGESALKEGKNIGVLRCLFNLRYPFWHVNGLKIEDSEMTENCRAALWYSDNIEIYQTKLHGIKALRECDGVKMRECDIISPEFGWSTKGIIMEKSSVESEYFMMRGERITFRTVTLNGKYAFQYITDALFENCAFYTKDALWHAKNVRLKNCVIKGEYLGWYSENVTFENCKIIGTQPLCYCKNLTLINCAMVNTDLAFERSRVEATITTPMISIKNPLSGHISVPEVGEIIKDIPKANCEITIKPYDETDCA